MSKYYLEIEVNEEASGYEDRLPWVSYGTLVAEGDSLEECLETASIDLVDQDGGERGIVEADAEWMQNLVIERFSLKYPKGLKDRADAIAESEKKSDNQVLLETYGKGEL